MPVGLDVGNENTHPDGRKGSNFSGLLVGDDLAVGGVNTDGVHVVRVARLEDTLSVLGK